jgi:hypothetical protein
MAGKMEGTTLDGMDQESSVAVMARLKELARLYQTQLVGLQELQRTLDEDIAGILYQLAQRPVIDIESLTSRLDATIDAVNRIMQRRIPRLMSRRWWVVWVWLILGIALGASGTWWTTQTPIGKKALALVWPQSPVAVPASPWRKK